MRNYLSPRGLVLCTHADQMRVLRNGVVREFGDQADSLPRDTSGQPVVGRTELGGQEIVLRKFTFYVPVPSMTGDLDEMPPLAGQGVGLVRDVPSATEVVERMATDAAALLARLGQGVPW